MPRILVVGAGFAGAVYARELADHGHQVTVIDVRRHLGGNCYDFLSPTGVRVHQYGPHIFHTSNEDVVDWLSRFTEWLPYEHRVVAKLADGRLLPMPVNLDTVNGVYGTQLTSADELHAFLQTQAEHRVSIRNAEDHLVSSIGPLLTGLFFQPYTQKMWGMSLSEIDASVVARVQIRAGQDDRYFPNDTFQAMPKDGYAAIFGRIFDHELIDVRLSTQFSYHMLDEYEFCFNSMPIDVFFDRAFGELPYRSIRFHTTEENLCNAPVYATINYTDTGPYTRETWWHNFPGHVIHSTGRGVRTVEEPCNYEENEFERYYPVKTSDGRHTETYLKYKKHAKNFPRLHFIGRCGTYQYLDMHQVINQSVKGARDWIRSHQAAA